MKFDRALVDMAVLTESANIVVEKAMKSNYQKMPEMVAILQKLSASLLSGNNCQSNLRTPVNGLEDGGWEGWLYWDVGWLWMVLGWDGMDRMIILLYYH